MISIFTNSINQYFVLSIMLTFDQGKRK